ncbi:MAG: addiction module protein [Isosphaeraceae bacterium]
MDLQAVLSEVHPWSAEDRLRLIEAIWDRLSAAPEAGILTEAQEGDLRRRLEAHRENPKAGSPWEEVKARLQRLTT